MKTLKLCKIEYRIVKQGTHKITGENVYLLEHPITKELQEFYEDAGVLVDPKA